MPTAKGTTRRQIEFGARVRARRVGLGMSQEALAHAAGIERSYVSQIEAAVRNPALENICKIAKALGMDSGDLMRGLQRLQGRT